MSEIDGKDINEFANLVESAYTPEEFNQLLQIVFKHSLSYYSGSGTSYQQYFNTGNKFLREGVFFELVKAIADGRPKRKDIQKYYESICSRLGYPNQGVPAKALEVKVTEVTKEPGQEKIIDSKKEDQEPLELAAWLPVAVRRVCQIGIKDKPIGTGFLVGCDLVLTAYHNISPIVDQKKFRAEDVRLTFGYVYEKDKITLQRTKTYNLQSCNWLIAYNPSEPSEADRNQCAVEDPPVEHLDYALLWVAGFPGNESIGDTKRGWFSIIEPVKLPEVKTNLYLLHHPAGVPLKYSEGDEVIRISKSKSRVDYRTNTKGGSSGAPCFNKNHELVALHNYGEANSSESKQDGFNRGIPIATIVKDLKRKGYFQFINRSTSYQSIPDNMEQVLEQVRKKTPNAYPFFNQLNKSLNETLDENKTLSIQTLVCLFWNYNWTDHNPNYWLFMTIGLHITIIGDPVMSKENVDRLIAQYEQYEKIGFDDPRLKSKIKNLNTSQGNQIIQEDKISLDDHYGNKRASLFFSQLSEVLSIRWQFMEHLHSKWPEIYIGSEIIGHSKSCLHEIKNDINYTLDIFRMYKKVNVDRWSPYEDERYKEFALLSEQIIEFLTGMDDEFFDLKRKLCYKKIENILPELEPQYVKLNFFISDYQDVLHDLIDISESSFQ